MPLPPYILKRYVIPGGVRLLSKEEPKDIAGLCAICTKPVVREKVCGMTQLNGLYSGGQVYHYRCKPIYSANDYPVTEVPVNGNLEPEEYRFWIGYRDSKSPYAMCRCCRESTYASKMRKEHFQSEKHTIGGKNCSARLAIAYEKLLTLNYCIVCRKQRFGHKKWGIPICEQVQCQNTWRFDTQVYKPLDMWLKLIEKKSDYSAKKVAEKYGDNLIDTNVLQTDKDGKTTYRPWCNVCLMMADSPEHEEEHMRRMLGGSIQSE
jgi:hypothetical protein